MCAKALDLKTFKFAEDSFPRVEELMALYESVGWTAYTSKPDLMAELLQKSLYHQTVHCEGRLVGLIRAVGDGLSIVYVQDILIDPAYQRLGLGRHLLMAVLERFSSVRQLILLTDSSPATDAFYRACGMEPVGNFQLSAYARFS